MTGWSRQRNILLWRDCSQKEDCAPPLAKYLQSHARLGSRLIEAFDAVALAAFTVVGVVVVVDTAARPLWLWGPIAAVLTGSFGGLMRDLLRHDRVVANLRGELYPEIAAVWGLAFAISWNGKAHDCSRKRSGWARS